MRKEFVMRGQTASGQQEILNFRGHKDGYAYRLTEFQLYPSSAIGTDSGELVGSITASKTIADPSDPNFNDEGLIATAFVRIESQYASEKPLSLNVVNDTFLITQNLILMVMDRSASDSPINWQCRFESVKMSGPEEAATNYKQFAIYD